MADSRRNPSANGPKVLIVGAGMSGILMAIRLKKAGYRDIVVVEKADRVGGTWRDNSYPGLHCDVPSHHYRYSFEPNPSWSKIYSSGAEIWNYLDKTARRYGVLKYVRFNTTAQAAHWDGARWNVELSTGETVATDVLVSATGTLHVPAYPDIEGVESFAGPSFHTSRWDHGIELSDKRIGMIGNGSTAVQITCALSGQVRKLIMFQRTAQWVAKVPNGPIPGLKRALYRLLPHLMDREYRAIETQTAIQTGGAIMGLDPAARAELERNVEENLASVRDPDLRRKLTPDHKVGCKRLIMSPSFYEAVQDPSVQVVTDRIERVMPQGVLTADGTLHELDLLVLATGFDPQAYVRPMKLTGIGGRTLEEVWAERPIAYKSMTVPYMPNFFMIEGPFSPLGNLSIILVSEWQVDYIMKCLDLIRTSGVALHPRQDVTERMMAEYREEARKTIWATGGCRSWYQDAEGVPIIYPYAPERFRDDMRNDPKLSDYEVVPLLQSA